MIAVEIADDGVAFDDLISRKIIQCDQPRALSHFRNNEICRPAFIEAVATLSHDPA